ncbi:AAA family ATPase [Aliarcobacter cryaerophilus]|uniref:AAA family ATPase n=1 Tax=Aliarcobacter cryaerophilus TaxID=28198 RepID=UPI003DA4B531
MEEIDYQGYSRYLELIGIENINTWKSYISENKLEILNSIKEYKNLTDEKKLIKFSNETTDFKKIFDTYHEYANDTTFNDLRSGARRYKYYLQYLGINKTLEEFDNGRLEYDLNGAYRYFEIFNNGKIYPIKVICKENTKILELSDNFTPSQAENILKRVFNKKPLENISFHDVKIDNKKENKTMPNPTQTQALNQILFGSPGTGKTYNTINKALEIILEKENNEEIKEILKKENHTLDDRKKLKAKFEEYKKAGQIEFITFHQSFSYEEFVEGIKAETKDDNISYEVQSGIFKKLCENAKPITIQENKLNFNWDKNNFFKMSLGGKSEIEILDWCLENNYISMGWGNEIDFSKINSEKWEDFRDNAKKLLSPNNIEFERFTLQAMYIFKEKMKKDDIVFISLGNLKIVAIGQIVGDYEFKDNIDEIRYSQFRKAKWLYINKDGMPVEKILNRKLSQQTIYNLEKSSVKKDLFDNLFSNKKMEDKNYILIIDEINRGNISKIFGELITLIEESKRLGNAEELEITLPYSNKPFGVPKNLYILGTMNTADRSIALMDTALRRRFHFEEMMPNPSLLEKFEVDGVKIDKLLETINKRVEYLYDRDHTIGHAYFMSLENAEDKKAELENIFRNKIIPLLQEYFYDDWEKVRLVLGDGFVEKIELKSDIFDEELRKDSEYLEEEKFIYNIKKEFDFSKFKD